MQSLFDRIHNGIDVRPLLRAVENNSKLWDQITARQDHPQSCHRDTRAIFLRWCKDISVETVFTDLVAVDYPALDVLGDARELIGLVAGLTKAERVGRVMITALKPGGCIIPHPDEGTYADHYERFHLVLHSDQGNLFTCQHDDSWYETVQMKAGELWTFNHKNVHHVLNGSRTDRIHMIIDAVAPLYRRERHGA